jgi:hypothetical protein
MTDGKPDVNAIADAPVKHLQIIIISQDADHVEFKVKPTTKFERASDSKTDGASVLAQHACIILCSLHS